MSGILKRRKTPYKHKVGKHTRGGRPVRNYERGKGDQKVISPKRRSRVVGGGASSLPSGFEVSVFYFDNSREQLGVDAGSYSGALGHGLEFRDAVSPVHLIRVRREKE